MLSCHCPWTMQHSATALRIAGAMTASLSLPYASRRRKLRPRPPLLTTDDPRIVAQAGRRHYGSLVPRGTLNLPVGTLRIRVVLRPRALLGGQGQWPRSSSSRPCRGNRRAGSRDDARPSAPPRRRISARYDHEGVRSPRAGGHPLPRPRRRHVRSWRAPAPDRPSRLTPAAIVCL